MAIPFLSVKVGKKGKAQPHADYIFRQGKYENDPEKPPTKTQKNYEDLVHKSHGNMPAWAEDNPELFWRMSDEFERKNGSTYREHVIALPREFNSLERDIAFIDEWIELETGNKHPYQYAIHAPLALDGKENRHVHIMFSDRTNDGIERAPDQFFKRYNPKNPERGGAKKANTGLKQSERVELLKEQRGRFEVLLNKHLELANSNERISMKSLSEQGITDREPVNFSMNAYRYDDFKQQQREFYDAREQQRVAESAKNMVIDVFKFDINAEIAKFEKRQREQNEKLKAEQLQQAIDEERTRLEREQKEREPQQHIAEPIGIKIDGKAYKDNFSKLYERHNSFIEDTLNRRMHTENAVKRADYIYSVASELQDIFDIRTSQRNIDIDELNKAHKAVKELIENFDKFIDKTPLKNNKKIDAMRQSTQEATQRTAESIEKKTRPTQEVAPTPQQAPQPRTPKL